MPLHRSDSGPLRQIGQGRSSPGPTPLESAPSAPVPEARSASPAPPGFSGERAWRDLTALTEIGPRAAGSEGHLGAIVRPTHLEDIFLKLTGTRLELDEEGGGDDGSPRPPPAAAHETSA